MDRVNRPNKDLVLFVFTSLGAVYLFLLSFLNPDSDYALYGVLLFGAGGVWCLRRLFNNVSFKLITPTALLPISIRQALLEWGVIILAAALVTSSLHNFTDQVQPTGVDIVQLPRAADFAGQFLRAAGKIPLWNPFIGFGEPMLESVQSFILNPLMSLPIMLIGAKPGVLVAILLHSVLFGIGGWVWARVMGFGIAGRLLTGALLVSSGSFTGPLSHGVFQLALSQAYIPYIYAGLIALLFLPEQRWGLVLFVTATALLTFSGTFWYVLPTAFGCGLIALFAILRFERGRMPRLDDARIRSLLFAGILVVGVVSIRVFTANRDLLHHPPNSYGYIMSYEQVLLNYVDPGYTDDKGQWYIVYHYVVPAWLLLTLVSLVILTWKRSVHILVGGWCVAFAGLLFVLLISVVSMGPTPLVNALYEAVPLLQDWRNPGRMAAAATPWVVLGVGWCFDVLARGAWRLTRQPMFRRLVGAAGLIALAIAGGAGVSQVGHNWTESMALLATDDLFVEHVTAAYYLRQRYPDQFLEIHTGWIQHFALNENLIRHPHGDNEVFTLGVPPTIGKDAVFFTYVEEFAYSDTPESGNGRWLREQGYIPLPGSPIVMPLGAILDYNPEALAYAYAVPEATIANLGYGQLLRSQTQPVTYYHRIDSVVLEVPAELGGQVLVANEMAYPGWTVTINDVPQPLESVNRRLAVRLPAASSSMTVVFRYQPLALYRWALLSVITIAVLIAYALRLDRAFLRRRKAA